MKRGRKATKMQLLCTNGNIIYEIYRKNPGFTAFARPKQAGRLPARGGEISLGLAAHKGLAVMQGNGNIWYKRPKQYKAES